VFIVKAFLGDGWLHTKEGLTKISAKEGKQLEPVVADATADPPARPILPHQAVPNAVLHPHRLTAVPFVSDTVVHY